MFQQGGRASKRAWTDLFVSIPNESEGAMPVTTELGGLTIESKS